MKTLKTSLLYQFVIATVSLGVSSSVCLGQDLPAWPQESGSVTADESTETSANSASAVSHLEEADSENGVADSQDDSTECNLNFRCKADREHLNIYRGKLVETCKNKKDEDDCRSYRPERVLVKCTEACPNSELNYSWPKGGNEADRVCEWIARRGSISYCTDRQSLKDKIAGRWDAACKKGY